MNTTYVPYLDCGCVEWTRDKEIIGLAKAKEAGLKMAKRCGRDTFYLAECQQWFPNVSSVSKELIATIEEQARDELCDTKVVKMITSKEREELDAGMNRLALQWLLRNGRVPDGVRLIRELEYKVKSNGRSVLVGSEYFD